MARTIEVTLGVEIDGTNTVFGLVDGSGSCLIEDKIPTRNHESPESLFSRMFKRLDDVVRKSQHPYQILGIGIGVPSANYRTGFVENSSNLNWKKVNIVEIVKQHHDLPVVITNDANAAAIGEKAFGVAQGMRNFIQITLGTGLGSGIVVDGNLVYGQNGFAGEIGHTIVERNGRFCGCGRRGCLETYASTSGIVRTAIELLALHNDESVLREVPAHELTSKLIFKAASYGDTIGKLAFEHTGRILGEALATAVAYLSPEAIILSEGLAQAGDLILDPTRRHMELNLLHLYRGKVRLLLSGLPKGDVAILGAGALIWHELRTAKPVEAIA